MNRPSWIKAKAPAGEEYEELKELVESARLHTVCQSACCPNIGECWRERTATFMILGNVCTRGLPVLRRFQLLGRRACH